jgi:hypothetical protein
MHNENVCVFVLVQRGRVSSGEEGEQLARKQLRSFWRAGVHQTIIQAATMF